MAETRARKRIREAVESRGYRIESIEWEPIYMGGEKEGACGGWTVILDRRFLENTFPGDDLYGLSVEEVLAGIDYWLQPERPCPCDRRHSAMTAARLINDPDKPTHDASCAWHIPYRLRWWKD